MADAEYVNIWMRPERPARGPKPVYSRAQITEAAIRIADAEGLEAATMRRIAAEIGAGAMSLYRYVPSRDNLVELMADRLMGEIDVTGMPSGDWRADLTRYADGLRAMWLRHPWIATVQRSLPSFGPNQLLLIERLMGVLDAFVSIDENLGLMAMLNGYIEGTVREEISCGRGNPPQRAQRVGVDGAELPVRRPAGEERGLPDLHQDRDGGAPAAPEPRRPVPVRAPARPRLHRRGPPWVRRLARGPALSHLGLA